MTDRQTDGQVCGQVTTPTEKSTKNVGYPASSPLMPVCLLGGPMVRGFFLSLKFKSFV